MNKISSAVILAGGKSLRMGFDKQFIKIDNDYLIKSIASKLKTIFEEIIIISNDPKISEIDFGFEVLIFKDDIRGVGPLGGIYTGLNKASSNMVYITACDMPNVNLDYINYLINSINDKSDGIVTKYKEWIEPLNAIYSKSNIEDIEAYIFSGNKNIYGYVKTRDFIYIEESKARQFSKNWEMFDNLNSEEDVRKIFEKKFY